MVYIETTSGTADTRLLIPLDDSDESPSYTIYQSAFSIKSLVSTAISFATPSPQQFLLENASGTQKNEGEIEQKFHRLTSQWKQETAPQSTISKVSMHPAYQRIIAMGERAIPLILRDLQKRPHHWFWALSAITNESPIPPESRGNMRAMTEAWIKWGKARRYIE